MHLPQPDGPISETNSPAPTVEVDVDERGDLVGLARVEDLADAGDLYRGSGHVASSLGRCRESTRSNSDDQPAITSPRTAAAITAV